MLDIKKTGTASISGIGVLKKEDLDSFLYTVPDNAIITFKEAKSHPMEYDTTPWVITATWSE